MWTKLTGMAVGVLLLLANGAQGGAGAATDYLPAQVTPPSVQREFRGVWIATVGNVDWPSKPGLSTDQQKKEMLKILDRAAEMNLNAIIFQVRPCSDAFYESKLEPWSYYITGVMGKAPSPYYDPLKFAIEEAHKRGMELHAWFSPYRAGHPSEKPPVATNHISRTRPGLVREYKDLQWLDPGEKEVQDWTVRVVMDVVDRYDIDAVHFDDRLGYPAEKDSRNQFIEFPDEPTYKRYKTQGGKLDKDDWRRENVDRFVERIYGAVKSSKPWVKVGIAPFGIWQQGNPPQVKGMSAYSMLYTDSRKWLANGWVDYFAPQLYWAISAPEQSFPVLLRWWTAQNARQRNVWPGLYAARVDSGAWKADEIVNQVKADRNGGSSGVILYSASCLVENSGHLASTLAKTVYSRPALVPASPWLEQVNPAKQTYPGKPSLKIESGKKAVWDVTGTNTVAALWVVQIQTGTNWQTKILPRDTRSMALSGSPDVVAVTMIDRCGVASPAAVLKKGTVTAPPPKTPARGGRK